MSDKLDRYFWTPPPQPLTVNEIQRGIAPVSYVRNERASDPFETELNHWSALPALSYFALNAVTLRESSRRIAPPTSFRPPPRLTLSDQRRRSWLDELRNLNVPLRALSRALPHGYTSGKLLDMLIDNDIPIPRALWFIKCIGANEVRALKRKHGVQVASDRGEHRRIETGWLSDWTEVVCDTIMGVINSFDDSLKHQAAAESSRDAKNNETDTLNMGSTKTTGRNSDAGEEDNAGVDSMEDLFEVPEEDAEDTESVSTEVWQKRVEYVSQLAHGLFNGSLLDRHAFLDWIVQNLRDCAIDKLPCFVHLTYLFWEPLKTSTMAPVLLRTATHRYRSAAVSGSRQGTPTSSDADRASKFSSNSEQTFKADVINAYFEPLVFKLMTSNEDIFVSPRVWPTIEPHVRDHPAYAKVAERNQAFMLHDPNPSDWTQQLEVGSLLDKFTRPYRLNELMANILALEMDSEVLVRTILLRTLRRDTLAGITLCIAVLKKLVQRSNGVSRVLMSECCVNFLLDRHLVYGSRILGDLVSELVRTKLCHLDLYLRKLISRGVLDGTPSLDEMVGETDADEGSDAHFRELHLRVLHDLPFDWLPPNMCTQVRILLQKSGRLREPENLDSLVHQCSQLLAGKQSVEVIQEAVVNLCTNDRHRLSRRLVQLFDEISNSAVAAPITPVVLSQFADLMETLGTGSVKPLFSILVCAVTSANATPTLVKCAVRQVHVRLMAFVCSGYVDGFVRRLISRLDSLRMESPPTSSNTLSVTNATNSRATVQNVLQWINWDDVAALRAVIQSPGVMCDLNSIVPLRQTASAGASLVAHTPVERDAVVHAALYNVGSPDVGTLIAMRGDETLAHDIVLWAHSPEVDRVALLQLLAYHAVSIHELVDASDKKYEMLRVLLLSPTSEFGFCFEELEALSAVRRQYLNELPLREILHLIGSVVPMQCASKIAHACPEFYMNQVIIPAMSDPELLELLRQATVAELRRFEVLLLRSTPFNLRYYQGLVMLAFHNKDPEDIAQEVLQAAYAHPDANAALQGLLQNLGKDVKNVIFGKTVNHFLASGLDEDQLPLLDVHYTLVGALADVVEPPFDWSLDEVPKFLEKLVLFADAPRAPWYALRRSLALVLRISVIGGLHSLKLPAAATKPLRNLLHKQVFADSYKVRMIIEDTLRVMQRFAGVCGDTPNEAVQNEESFKNGPSVTDGLRVYSKSQNHYGPLPVWAFDLIEDANPTIGKNDGAVDLTLFEAYED